MEAYSNLSPLQFSKAIQALTIADAVQLDQPNRMQLNQLANSDTDEFLVLQICAIGDYLDKPMNPEKACMIVADLFEKYWYFTLNDVLMFLKRGRQGAYNEDRQIVTQYNAQTILMWASKYEVERTEYISKERTKENQMRKAEPISELPQDLYKGAVYNPSNEAKKKREQESEYSKAKAQYFYHKQNGTLDEFLNLKTI